MQKLSADKKHWVEIAVLDMENHPVAGVEYSITVPNGTVVTGSTDANGRGRVEGIDAGNCTVRLTKLDKDSWQKK